MSGAFCWLQPSYVSAIALTLTFVNLIVLHQSSPSSDSGDFLLRLSNLEQATAEMDDAISGAVEIATEANDRAGEAILNNGFRSHGSR